MLALVKFKVRCSCVAIGGLHKEMGVCFCFRPLRIGERSPDVVMVAIQIVGVGGFKTGYADVFGMASSVAIGSVQVFLVSGMELQ